MTTDQPNRRVSFQLAIMLLAASVGLGLLLGPFPLQAQPPSAEGGPASLSPATHRSSALLDVQITVDDIVASGFDRPVQVTHAGDGSDRLFVVEQPGRIWIIRSGSVLPKPFLDIRSLVYFEGERGLLSVAFHPQYGSNGQFFVNYTRAGDGATVIARYEVSDSDPSLADPESATVLLTISQPYPNHNGGQLAFGPADGYLYIGMGDGGSAGDPLNHAQNTDTLLGAMLRLNVDGGTPYAIPADNPYVGGEGRDEIWAIGLRNPWRFSFDRGTGDLYIGDVGQNSWEEIDYQAAGTPGGVNYGWRCKEGTHDYDFTGACLTRPLTDPVAEYDHTEGRSVTGGTVYRGSRYPNLVGRYFYADYVSGRIWSLYKTGTNPDTWAPPDLELDTGLNISAFGEDESGELYVVDREGGAIRRLADASGPDPDLSTSQKRASAPSADPGETVAYTIYLNNTGGLADAAILLTDTIPVGLSYLPGSLWASHGTWDDSQTPILTWQGNLSASQVMTITYQARVTGAITGSIVNRAQIASESLPPLALASSLYVPRSVLDTTRHDFFVPGTQPKQLEVGIPPSIDCDTCHTEQVYDKWRGSMMSQAGRDPLLWAALAVANVDAPGAGDYCLRCHTPRGWLEGRSHPSDGSALQPPDLSNGIACNLCHRLVDPISSAADETAAIDLQVRAALTASVPLDYVGSGALIVDPDDNRRGPFSFDPVLPFHTAYQTSFLGQIGDAATRARLCGMCHNVDNPLLVWDEARGQYWPSGAGSATSTFPGDLLFPIETTFDEWLNSEYARSGVFAPQFAGNKPDGIVRACQDCHLPRTVGTAADPAFNPVSRDCETTGCLPEHVMVGGNTWTPQLLQTSYWRLNAASDSPFLRSTVLEARRMLHKSASVSISLTASDTVKIATVRVINHAGHKLPTGYPEGRRMWLHVQAFDADGQLVYESGAYDATTGEIAGDSQVYEVKQGITPELAAFLKRSPGASFHFVLNNTTVKDNRIPPRGYLQALFDRTGLRPVGATYEDGQYWDDAIYLLPAETARVTATLYYQTASREYIDFLQAHGGVDGVSLGQLSISQPSAPEIVAQAWLPSHKLRLPLAYKAP